MNKFKRISRLIISIVICIAIIIIGFLATYFIFVKQIQEQYKNEINIRNQIIEENKKEVFVAKRDLKAGEIISLDLIESVNIFLSINHKDLINTNDIGKTLLVDIKGGFPIYKTMVHESFLSNDLREDEFAVFHLNSNLLENDYVDIRIMYPNGENYLVLSKKRIKDLSIENNICFLWMNANERLMISSAIIDCYLNEGTKLYTSKYIEPNIQEASIVNYMPSEEIINLLLSDPNIIEVAKEALLPNVRKEKEKRLKDFYEENNPEKWQINKSDYIQSNSTIDKNIEDEVDFSNDINDEEEFYYDD